MRFEMDPLGFKIIPETPQDGYRLGFLAGSMGDDACIQRDLDNTHVMLVNTKQLARVDEELPWQGTGLGRVGFIHDLLNRAGNDASPEIDN